MYQPPHLAPYTIIDRTTVTAKAVIARLRGFVGIAESPETPEQAADRRQSLRRAAGDELARMEAERDAELPRLAASEEKARKHLEKVTPGYRQAVADFDRAQAKHNVRAQDFAYARMTILRRVEAASEPLIDEFVQDLYGLLETNLKTLIDRDIRTVGYDKRTMRDVKEEWSNIPSITARRIAILAAINEAHDMKTDPDQGGIRERLVKIVEALPDNTVLVKVDER